ncbi:unnamed protein product [Laminaria digitata]
MRMLVKKEHPNIVCLKHCFYSNGDKPDELYLNLVLEFVPETVYSVARHYHKSKQTLPMLLVKLYLYQLARALAHIHALGICHRDIKPQNLLLDPQTHVLKLCDFGSAKILVRGEPNVSYICSRYYRAPELIFGSTDYTCAIDTWSLGCVAAELMLGEPLFPGDSGVDQLVEIIKVLGTPTREEICAMNYNYSEFKFPQIKAHPWKGVFRSRTPTEVRQTLFCFVCFFSSHLLSSHFCLSPSTLRYVPSFLSREEFSTFFPRRLASNTLSSKVCPTKKYTMYSIRTKPFPLLLTKINITLYYTSFSRGRNAL